MSAVLPRVATAVGAFVALLASQGCAPIATEPSDPQSVQALASSLVYATEEICVPFIVDDASIDSLTERSDISERRDEVHGKMVTSYILDRPGAPEVTLSDASASHDYCWVLLKVERPSDRQHVVAAFVDNLRLNGRATSQPHAVETEGVLRTDPPNSLSVVCIDGETNGLITISNPQYVSRFSLPGEIIKADERVSLEISVHVQSDQMVLAAEGCVS